MSSCTPSSASAPASPPMRPPPLLAARLPPSSTPPSSSLSSASRAMRATGTCEKSLGLRWCRLGLLLLPPPAPLASLASPSLDALTRGLWLTEIAPASRPSAAVTPPPAVRGDPLTAATVLPLPSPAVLRTDALTEAAAVAPPGTNAATGSAAATAGAGAAADAAGTANTCSGRAASGASRDRFTSHTDTNVPETATLSMPSDRPLLPAAAPLADAFSLMPSPIHVPVTFPQGTSTRSTVSVRNGARATVAAAAPPAPSVSDAADDSGDAAAATSFAGGNDHTRRLSGVAAASANPTGTPPAVHTDALAGGRKRAVLSMEA